ncbi:DUF2252 family protein [Cupriavidus necator]|uniref:DUF2252 domain-containing protein n=1 Tax=Cupriavidus necator TaxID=106590 RepID=A0A367PSJ9_CUPNE|nr:DUF2252 family protein [Cupriavidus necator]QQX86570.1 DUF2252 family protein [Cupriavidus necator]RCJ10016.1 DUF2252 domain-containing protein [Cupriavidus necator]
MTPLMQDVTRYEDWLRRQCDVVEADLNYKHQRMLKGQHTFLRATYFRWAKRVKYFAGDCLDAPHVLAIGDCHVENFGTWRDGEGRQVWGVNDFDDAAVMPYTLDLVRLATSATLAQKREAPALEVCAALLEGYVDGIQRPGPILLEQGHPWFGKLLHELNEKTKDFWQSFERSQPADVPREIERLFKRALPATAKLNRISPQQRGGGGLGRPRYSALATWNGGSIVREAKALVPSSWDWARGRKSATSRFITVATGAYRSPDPFLYVTGGFILRRLAPESRKLDLDDVTKAGRGPHLLRAMGRDVGSIHAAHRRTPKVLDHLLHMPKTWLVDCVERSTNFVLEDFNVWRGLVPADDDARQR